MISFKSKILVKILNYYFLNPEAELYINELAKKLELDPKNVDRKLKELEREGLFTSEFRGKERFFSINIEYPLLEQYRQIFIKTHGLVQRLKEITRDIYGINEMYIFGSYAKNKMEASSDVDILAIGKHSTLELQKKINILQKEFGREFNVVNMSEDELKKKKMSQFVKNIFSGAHIKI
ncbi:nucleotidyltransferase domain-containing protein [Candidatus Saganbacteria bacterium]|nr:nucleotidyltransferase domain-containing protein [Candidatus Saganbacteria bacterium]